MSGWVFLAGDETALLDLARAVRATGYRFVTVTPATHQRVNARPQNGWARNLTDIFGWSRPFRKEVVPASLFDVMRAGQALVPWQDGWRSLVRLTTLDDELFVHSAYPTVDADSVFFGPDTGRLVQAVVSHLGQRTRSIRRAVDIGCGAGAGAIAVAKRLRDAQVLGVDINPAALRATELNARLVGVDNVSARASNMLHDVEGEFDLIVSNPPFMIDAARRSYRDGGGPLGAELPLACVDAAIDRLAVGGTLVLFTGAVIVDGENQFHNEAARRLDRAGLAWKYCEVDPDAYGEELSGPAYARADRIALTLLTATRSS